jgi:integrase
VVHFQVSDKGGKIRVVPVHAMAQRLIRNTWRSPARRLCRRPGVTSGDQQPHGAISTTRSQIRNQARECGRCPLRRGLFSSEKALVAPPARKTGKLNEMPCHHKLESYLDAYIEAAGIEDDRKGPLFCAAIGKTKTLGPGAMSRTDVWYMVRRRAADAGIETAISCHTFRATGITDYLTNGGRIEVAQKMAGHSNAKTTGLYDRRNDDISVGEVERIGI